MGKKPDKQFWFNEEHRPIDANGNPADIDQESWCDEETTRKAGEWGAMLDGYGRVAIAGQAIAGPVPEADLIANRHRIGPHGAVSAEGNRIFADGSQEEGIK